MRLPGHRIVKTAVAVFLTAFICAFIGWPPVFAVITAIVTLEPTVSDSIKKGIIRFPASAIGSFYAVLFISLFGNSVLTYTLAATLTIMTCYRFKLHAGLLVATITAVAMVEVIYDNYWMSFFIRLGTTSIGITISTLVNMFIFPPNYKKEIETNLQQIYIDLGKSLSYINEKTKMKKALSHANIKIEKTEQLIRYQVDEENFRTLFEKENIEQPNLLKQLQRLELIHYHLIHIQPIEMKETTFSDEQITMIYAALTDVTRYMIGNKRIYLAEHEEKLKHVMNSFWQSNHGKEAFIQSSLPKELILLYEVISLFHLINHDK